MSRPNDSALIARRLEKIQRCIRNGKIGMMFELHHSYHHLSLARYAESLGRKIISVINQKYNFNRYSDKYEHICCGYLTPVSQVRWKTDNPLDIHNSNCYYICEGCKGTVYKDSHDDNLSSFSYRVMKGPNCIIIVG